MKWTSRQLRIQSDKLDPLTSPCLDFVIDTFPNCSINCSISADAGIRAPCKIFHEGDRMIDVFMASSEFDKDLFIMLVKTLDIDVETALRMCLS
jgi:hypothetical protein